MPLDRPDLDEVTQSDIDELIANSVSEGYRLEFKRQPYGNSDGDRREFLKDVTALANATGGHLIVGIDAKDGVARSLVPLQDGAIDAEFQRLESLLRDGVEPRVSGIRMRAVQVDGGAVLIVRVPRSWNQPHRVSHGRSNRFYVRNSSGVHEASVEELRRLFSGSAQMMDRVRDLHRHRHDLIRHGRGPVRLADTGHRLLVHVVPLAAFAEASEIELLAAEGLRHQFAPLGVDSYSHRFNFEGFLVYRPGPQCHGYTQVFRNGVLEAVKVDVVVQNLDMFLLPGGKFSAQLMESFPRYMEALRKLDVPTPLVFIASLEGVRDVQLATRRGMIDEDVEPFLQDELQFSPAIIEEYGNSAHYRKAMRPVFDTLWNAGGYARCEYFNSAGEWEAPSYVWPR